MLAELDDFESSPYQADVEDILDADEHDDGDVQGNSDISQIEYFGRDDENYVDDSAYELDTWGFHNEPTVEVTAHTHGGVKLELSTRISNNAEKAGLEQCDKEKVAQVINQSTKGSRYHNKTMKDDRRIKARVENMTKAYSQMKQEDFAHSTRAADRLMEKLEADRDLSKSWLHVDMDAFYASVEIRDNPDLAGIPMAVGSTAMLCTSSYEARKYGVRSAMPGFIALKLCPQLTIVPTDFAKYKEASYQTREVFSRYDPNFEAYSLDEASLDITTHLFEHPGKTAEDTATEIRKAIQAETKLTCSIGSACNRRLAKICSNINKPDGQFLLPSVREDIIAFMENLSIRKAPGIGKVTEKLLNSLNITKCGELYTERATLLSLFSSISADFFFRLALGLGSTLHTEARTNRSVSTERTFAHTSDPTVLYQKCYKLSHSLAETLKKKYLEGKTLTLKLKTANFETRTKSITLNKYWSNGDEIYTQARKLLTEEMPIDLRLMGVRMSGFKEPQSTLIDGYFSKKSTTTAPATKTSPNSNKITHFLQTIDHTQKHQQEEVLCPICSKDLSIFSKDNFNINMHIDNCLQRQATLSVKSSKKQKK